MRKETISYRTTDGLADYQFSFEEQPEDDWRIYIEWQPSYQGRETGIDATHRWSEDDRFYVCWTEDLHSLDDAKNIAALWADTTQNYIRTGRFQQRK